MLINKCFHKPYTKPKNSFRCSTFCFDNLKVAGNTLFVVSSSALLTIPLTKSLHKI